MNTYRFSLKCGLCFDIRARDEDEAVENAKEMLHEYEEGVVVDLLQGDDECDARFYPSEAMIAAISKKDIVDGDDEEDDEDDDEDEDEDEEDDDDEDD